MIDWRIRHTNQANDLLRKGWRLIADDISLDEFVLRARRKQFRPGTTWLWAIGQVLEPPKGTSNE